MTYYTHTCIYVHGCIFIATLFSGIYLYYLTDVGVLRAKASIPH